MVSTIIACAFLLPALVAAQNQYNQVKEYAGATFFDDWNFYNNFDNLTNGNVNYLSANSASSSKLAFVNDAGNAIIKVDNTSQISFPDRRNSIRINTKDQYTIGTLWVADMLHVPYGCSVWPAFWSSASEWPAGGEIDTFEAVNQVTMNQMGLHTAAGCMHSNTSIQTSTLINSTDCDINANSNEGCIITNPTTKSYGADFANAGGGVWVTEFAATGISIWFFTRSSVPTSLQGNASTIDTSTFGTPVANWAEDGCEVPNFFDSQSLIFDISLCGDYAGSDQTFYQTCTGVCYEDWVLGDPSHYDTAYFEVSYVRVYGTPGELTVIGSSSAPSTYILQGLSLFAGLLFSAALLLF